MARSCCAKPITRIIKVAEFDAGLLGLDQAIQNVYDSGITDDEGIQRSLLKWIKEFGNYITPSREDDYSKALLREYRNFVTNVQREGEEKRI